MNTANLASFTEAERHVTAIAINRYGSAQHPVATTDNLNYFSADYCIECLQKATADGKLSDKGAAAASAATRNFGGR